MIANAVHIIAPPKLADVTDAVGVWTNANDIALNDPAAKPKLTMQCGQEVEVLVEAITARMGVGNFRLHVHLSPARDAAREL